MKLQVDGGEEKEKKTHRYPTEKKLLKIKKKNKILF